VPFPSTSFWVMLIHSGSFQFIQVHLSSFVSICFLPVILSDCLPFPFLLIPCHSFHVGPFILAHARSFSIIQVHSSWFHSIPSHLIRLDFTSFPSTLSHSRYHSIHFSKSHEAEWNERGWDVMWCHRRKEIDFNQFQCTHLGYREPEWNWVKGEEWNEMESVTMNSTELRRTRMDEHQLEWNRAEWIEWNERTQWIEGG
jgi:hypothetical protein